MFFLFFLFFGILCYFTLTNCLLLGTGVAVLFCNFFSGTCFQRTLTYTFQLRWFSITIYLTFLFFPPSNFANTVILFLFVDVVVFFGFVVETLVPPRT